MNNEKIVSGERSEPISKDIGAKALNLLERQDLRAEFDSQLKDSEKIRDDFSRITGNLDFLSGVSYAREDEEGFSGDGASLFMLVKFQKDGGDKTELVKIGWGEFSKQVFIRGGKSKYSDYVPEYKDGKDYGYKAKHEVLRNLPFDVYCVDQRDSYFADEETQKDMCFNPEKYLRGHALFVARDGEVTMATEQVSGHHELEYDIRPVSEDEAEESIEQMKKIYQETIDKLSEANK